MRVTRWQKNYVAERRKSYKKCDATIHEASHTDEEVKEGNNDSTTWIIEVEEPPDRQKRVGGKKKGMFVVVWQQYFLSGN